MALKFAQFTWFARFTHFTLFAKFTRFANQVNRKNRVNYVNSVNQVNCVNFLVFALCSLLFFLGGCASLSQKEVVLAIVDGEPVTEEDLQYSLNIAHRREDLSSAGALNLLQYVTKLVDDRLFINEARNTGMDQYPEMKQAIETYILRESVVRLHDEEIVQKVSVTEKEIKDYYKKNYEKVTLGLIELKSDEEAKAILEQLKNGGDFKEIALKYSTHSAKGNAGEIVLTRKALTNSIGETVSGLNPNDFSDVIKTTDRYYIIKLIDRKEAPDEEFNDVKGRIEKEIRKQKEKKRSDEYLKYLREKAIIKVDRELLSTIKLEGDSGNTENWSKDKRPLVEVNGSVLTIADLFSMKTPSSVKSKDDIMNTWIDYKLVDHEALRRHYEMNTDLKKMVYQYENQILKNTFIKRIIMPQVVVSEKALEEYYSQHQKSFSKPVRFKIQHIAVKSMDEAQEIMNNLQNGADFSWLAKRKSNDSNPLKGEDTRWFTKAELMKPVQDIIETLKIGDISPIIKLDSSYAIFKVQEKTEATVEPFDKVKDAVYKAYFNEQINTLIEKYVNQLKAEAQIKIYEDEIKAFEGKFKQ